MIVPRNNRGDTIIEVLLAMTLLTLILFISWGLVNRTTQISLAARKRVEMVNQVKEQAEILKATYAANGGKINSSLALGPTSINDYDDAFCSNPDVVGLNPTGAFHFDSGTVKRDIPKLVENNPGSKVWIQRNAGSGAGVDQYTDFFVRACWQAVGSQQQTDNVQVVLRLNNE